MGRVIVMKSLFVLLLLSLATLALPGAQAAPPPVAECSSFPWSPGGDTHCEGTVGPCAYLVHVYDQEDALNQYRADCLGCWLHYGGGPLAGCEVVQTAAARPEPCQTGIAQTWCDATVGPCDVRVVPWTAWGDAYAWADCRFSSMTRCYVEAHVQDPLNPEQWCAF
jgi:hypothetical protein